MVFQSIEDPKVCEPECRSSSRASVVFRRAVLVAAGMAALVAGVFVLTHGAVHVVEEQQHAVRRRLANTSDMDDAGQPCPEVQAFLYSTLPKIQMEQGRKHALADAEGPKRRLEMSDDDRFINIDVSSDIFYVVNVFNNLGRYVCSITRDSLCDTVLALPGEIRAEWITGLLQGLRDTEDGLDGVKQFDAAALQVAHNLVNKGAQEAQKEVDDLQGLFDLSTALAATQITGNIVAAVLSFTPFAAVGATFSLGLNSVIDVVTETVTSGEIEDARGSVAAEILDMGTYADQTPLLAYLKAYHTADAETSTHMARLYAPKGPLAVANGANVVMVRRFLSGLARGTDDIADMYEFLIRFHNSFRQNPSNQFQFWRDVARSMVAVDKEDITSTLSLVDRAEDHRIETLVFDNVANVFLGTGFMTAKKAQTWSKRTYAYKARNAPLRSRKLYKLRAMSEKPKAPRKALMYSRMTAGLSILGAVVQGISLGFQVAEQDKLVDSFNADIVKQSNNIKQYYTNLYIAVEQMKASETSYTPAPTNQATPSPTFTPGQALYDSCSDDVPCRGDLYCKPYVFNCGAYVDAGEHCDAITWCSTGLNCVSRRCQ